MTDPVPVELVGMARARLGDDVDIEKITEVIAISFNRGYQAGYFRKQNEILAVLGLLVVESEHDDD